MTDEQSPYVLYPQASPPSAQPRSSRWLLWTGLGCGGSLLAMLLFCGGCGLWVWRGKSDVEPSAAEFLGGVDRANDFEVYESLGQEWRAIQTEEAFSEFVSRVRELLGPLKSKTFRGIYRGTGTQGQIARVTYLATYAKGAVHVEVSLKETAGGWKVIGCHWNTPLLQAALKCPHCSAVNRSLGLFCASCGKPMKDN